MDEDEASRENRGGFSQLICLEYFLHWEDNVLANTETDTTTP